MSGARIPYEPSLDGLRALSVLAIAAFHSDMPWASGGFLGVDVFFVLSGYLITRLLLAEWTSAAGISLADFWGRRVRRLLPALLLLLCGVALYVLFASESAGSARIRSDALSTLLYVNNWWQIIQGQSYFDNFRVPSPLHHA